jgi:hypothetical protein
MSAASPAVRRANEGGVFGTELSMKPAPMSGSVIASTISCAVIAVRPSIVPPAHFAGTTAYANGCANENEKKW